MSLYDQLNQQTNRLIGNDLSYENAQEQRRIQLAAKVQGYQQFKQQQEAEKQAKLQAELQKQQQIKQQMMDSTKNSDLDSMNINKNTFRLQNVDSLETYHPLDNLKFDPLKVNESYVHDNYDDILKNQAPTIKKEIDPYAETKGISKDQALLEILQQNKIYGNPKLKQQYLQEHQNDENPSMVYMWDKSAQLQSEFKKDYAETHPNSIYNQDPTKFTTGAVGAFGRQLVDDKQTEEDMIKAGLAIPNVQNQDDYIRLSKLAIEAKNEGKGYWADPKTAKYMESKLKYNGATEHFDKQGEGHFWENVKETPGSAVYGFLSGGTSLAHFVGTLALEGTNELTKAINGHQYIKNPEKALWDQDKLDKELGNFTAKIPLVGYNPNSYQHQQEAKRVAFNFEQSMNGVKLLEPSSWGNIEWSSIGKAALEVAKDPTMAGQSLGYLAGPGLVGKVATFGVKGVMALKDLDESMNVAQKTKFLMQNSKEVEVAKQQMTQLKNIEKQNPAIINDPRHVEAVTKLKDIIDNAKLKYGFVAKRSAMLSYTASIVDQDMREYQKNNNGKTMSLPRVAGDFVSEYLAVAAPEMALTKFEVGMKSSPIKLPEIKNNIMKAFNHLAVAGIIELPQETMQAIIQDVSQKYGTEKYKDKTVAQLLNDDTAEILNQGISGSIGGVHMASIGAVRIFGQPITDRLKTKQQKEREAQNEQTRENIIFSDSDVHNTMNTITNPEKYQEHKQKQEIDPENTPDLLDTLHEQLQNSNLVSDVDDNILGSDSQDESEKPNINIEDAAKAISVVSEDAKTDEQKQKVEDLKQNIMNAAIIHGFDGERLNSLAETIKTKISPEIELKRKLAQEYQNRRKAFHEVFQGADVINQIQELHYDIRDTIYGIITSKNLSTEDGLDSAKKELNKALEYNKNKQVEINKGISNVLNKYVEAYNKANNENVTTEDVISDFNNPHKNKENSTFEKVLQFANSKDENGNYVLNGEDYKVEIGYNETTEEKKYIQPTFSDAVLLHTGKYINRKTNKLNTNSNVATFKEYLNVENSIINEALNTINNTNINDTHNGGHVEPMGNKDVNNDTTNDNDTQTEEPVKHSYKTYGELIDDIHKSIIDNSTTNEETGDTHINNVLDENGNNSSVKKDDFVNTLGTFIENVSNKDEQIQNRMLDANSLFFVDNMTDIQKQVFNKVDNDKKIKILQKLHDKLSGTETTNTEPEQEPKQQQKISKKEYERLNDGYKRITFNNMDNTRIGKTLRYLVNAYEKTGNPSALNHNSIMNNLDSKTRNAYGKLSDEQKVEYLSRWASELDSHIKEQPKINNTYIDNKTDFTKETVTKMDGVLENKENDYISNDLLNQTIKPKETQVDENYNPDEGKTKKQIKTEDAFNEIGNNRAPNKKDKKQISYNDVLNEGEDEGEVSKNDYEQRIQTFDEQAQSVEKQKQDTKDSTEAEELSKIDNIDDEDVNKMIDKEHYVLMTTEQTKTGNESSRSTIYKIATKVAKKILKKKDVKETDKGYKTKLNNLIKFIVPKYKSDNMKKSTNNSVPTIERLADKTEREKYINYIEKQLKDDKKVSLGLQMKGESKENQKIVKQFVTELKDALGTEMASKIEPMSFNKDDEVFKILKEKSESNNDNSPVEHEKPTKPEEPEVDVNKVKKELNEYINKVQKILQSSDENTFVLYDSNIFGEFSNKIDEYSDIKSELDNEIKEFNTFKNSIKNNENIFDANNNKNVEKVIYLMLINENLKLETVC